MDIKPFTVNGYTFRRNKSVISILLFLLEGVTSKLKELAPEGANSFI